MTPTPNPSPFSLRVLAIACFAAGTAFFTLWLWMTFQ